MKRTKLWTAVALLTGGALVAGASGTAAAATAAPADDFSYVIYDGSVYRGFFEWKADPSDGAPGDAMRVTDDVADGYGIEADLNTSPTRIATTQGHSSPYTSPWATGDLPEDKSYTVDIYLVKGGTYTYLRSWTVTS